MGALAALKGDQVYGQHIYSQISVWPSQADALGTAEHTTYLLGVCESSNKR